MSYETAKTVSTVITEIDRGNYVLPSIQREFVWSTNQIETLFDSLMQDYPIGSFLFWQVDKEKYNEYDFYRFIREYHERDCAHNPKANLSGESDVIAILDGQQRLTSLYLGLKGSYAEKIRYKKRTSNNAFPKKKLYLNLLCESENYSMKYDFSFLTKDDLMNASEEDTEHHWFEVGKILDMNDIGDVMDYIEEHITFNDFYTKEKAKFARKTLTQLFQVVNTAPTISYYLERNQDLDKVLNIFIRVNSGGTVLSYSDLLLSIASSQWEHHDAREEINEFVDEINCIGDGFRINKDFVLKSALVLSDFKNIAFKVDNFNKTNMLKIENNWDEIRESIRLAFQLIYSFGYSGDTLKSNNAVIPIAYYLKQIDAPSNFVESSKNIDNKLKIRKWLVTSLLKRAFSGQPDNVLRPIRDMIRENGNNEFPLDRIVNQFKGTNKTIVFTKEDIDENLMKLQYSNSYTLSTLMLLYKGYDYSNSIHIDHIFPRSLFKHKNLKEFGLTDSDIDFCISNRDSLANLQLLPALPNIEKQNKEFNMWFDKQNPTDTMKIQYRNTHYIPNMEYNFQNFKNFISYRESLLKIECEKALLH